MNRCDCNFEETGRCWLAYDEWWFQKNLQRLCVGDALCVYTFAILERQRLQQKAYDMTIHKIEQITIDTCCKGTRFSTEAERNAHVAKIAGGGE